MIGKVGQGGLGFVQAAVHQERHLPQICLERGLTLRNQRIPIGDIIVKAACDGGNAQNNGDDKHELLGKAHFLNFVQQKLHGGSPSECSVVSEKIIPHNGKKHKLE